MSAVAMAPCISFQLLPIHFLVRALAYSGFSDQWDTYHTYMFGVPLYTIQDQERTHFH